MIDTPVSLIESVRRQGDAADWERFLGLYTPWIRRWVRRDRLLRHDADDLTQEVLAALVKGLPEFIRRRPGSFRHWLRTITVHRLTDHWRERHTLERVKDAAAEESILMHLADPSSELSRQWDREHDLHVFKSVLAMIKPQFSRQTWRAFKRYCLDEKPAQVVASQLGVSKNVVLLAKSRVLKRCRAVARGLIED